MDFSGKPHYHKLKEKWSVSHHALQQKLWDKHKDSLAWASKNLSPKQIAVGSLSSLLLLAAPVASSMPSSHLSVGNQETTISKNGFLVADLSHVLPKEMRPLTID